MEHYNKYPLYNAWQYRAPLNLNSGDFSAKSGIYVTSFCMANKKFVGQVLDEDLVNTIIHCIC